MLLSVQPALGFESSLTFDAEDTTKSPVSKVVNLLKDMLAQMEKEAEEDQDVYDKVTCWCETNDKEKTKSIADGEAKIKALTISIEEYTALSAQLNTEIKNLESEVAKNQKALDEATATRMKELAELQGEEKDMLGAISALKSAVTVLSKHNSAASLLQVVSSQEQMVAAKLGYVMQKHSELLKFHLTHSQRKEVMAFIQNPQPGSYAPQSGQIFASSPR
jgi:chromosome segregation ATPase